MGVPARVLETTFEQTPEASANLYRGRSRPRIRNNIRNRRRRLSPSAHGGGCGFEMLGGGADSVGGGGADTGEEWQMSSGLSNLAQRYRFVQDSNRVNLVSQIFQRAERGANGFGEVVVLFVDRLQHRLRESRVYADAAGCIAGESELGEMDNRGLLTDSTADQLRINEGNQLLEERVICRVFANNGVLDE